MLNKTNLLQQASSCSKLKYFTDLHSLSKKLWRQCTCHPHLREIFLIFPRLGYSINKCLSQGDITLVTKKKAGQYHQNTFAFRKNGKITVVNYVELFFYGK